jgi:hypothetical protein
MSNNASCSSEAIWKVSSELSASNKIYNSVASNLTAVVRSFNCLCQLPSAKFGKPASCSLVYKFQQYRRL